MKMQITMKSGAQIIVDIKDLSIRKNGLGDLTRLEWTTPAEFSAKLVHLQLDQVAAVVRLADAALDVTAQPLLD